MDAQAALAFFKDIIRIPSVTGTPAEAEVVHFLARQLEGMGLQPRLAARVPGRPNLLVRLAAPHPVNPPLVLLSHIDVVPADAAEWRHPPFSAEEAEGRVWGRGTLDTKHLTAMQLYALAALQGAGTPLNRDIWLVAAADEEMGSHYGVEFLAETEPELFAPGALVISEGGGFPVVAGGRPFLTLTAGEKGLARVKLAAKGQGGHPGAPGDALAIVHISKALAALLQAAAAFAPVPADMYTQIQNAFGGAAPQDIEDAAARDIYHYAGENSAGLRNYRLGQRSNIIPPQVETEVEFKLLPGITAAMLEGFLAQQLAAHPVTWSLASFEPGFQNQPQNMRAFMQLAQKAGAQHGLACEVMPMLALGRTDGRFFGARGAQVYGFSPLLPEDGFARTLKGVHGPNESVGVESFLFGCKVLKDVCLQLATG